MRSRRASTLKDASSKAQITAKSESVARQPLSQAASLVLQEKVLGPENHPATQVNPVRGYNASLLVKRQRSKLKGRTLTGSYTTVIYREQLGHLAISSPAASSSCEKHNLGDDSKRRINQTLSST